MKMNEKMFAVMREAAQMLQSGGPSAATEKIQRTLNNLMPSGVMSGGFAQPASERAARPMKDINPPPFLRTGGTGDNAGFVSDLLTGLGVAAPLDGGKFDMPAFAPQTDLDTKADRIAGGKFIAGSYTNHAGTRQYKLYVPTGYSGQPLPLVVMLHGCTQNPDDFAAGTRMNAIAEEKQCLVAYPAQSQSANGSKCWNWFNAIDQQREQGEPSIIAGITREIIKSYHVDARQVYIAGLSAGGAMAVVMGTAYPDLYAAVGIHSGLPYAAADDLPSALAAMKGGMAAAHGRKAHGGASASGPQTKPIIVFHGDRDKTVHPRNGDQIVMQSVAHRAGTIESPQTTVQKGKAPDGHAYTQTIHHDENGQAVAEQWLVHGAGHAWFGGSNRGTYTDAKGPDATQEMMRFFSTHPQPVR
jgi:poly(hydroxyalkanoate) depolymerase family esterase